MSEFGISRIKEIIGQAAYDDLVDAMPGKRLTIPNQATPNHPIAAVIGFEAAQKLSVELGTMQFELPMSGHKKKVILAALQNGEPSSSIARRHFVSRRFVLRLKAEAAKTAPHPSLF